MYPATLAIIQNAVLKPLRIGAHSKVIGTVAGTGAIFIAACTATEGFIAAARATTAGMTAHGQGAALDGVAYVVVALCYLFKMWWWCGRNVPFALLCCITFRVHPPSHLATNTHINYTLLADSDPPPSLSLSLSLSLSHSHLSVMTSLPMPFIGTQPCSMDSSRNGSDQLQTLPLLPLL
jgi:hypothetical protein